MKTTQWDPKQQYFFCYMLNIEIINYSSVQSLFETLMWKCHSNITPRKHSSWWRRLPSSSSEDVFKTSSWRLDQGEYIHFSHTSSEDVFKKFPRRLKTNYSSLRHLQDVFKTHHLVKLLLLTRPHDIFETASGRFWDVLQKLSTERFA